MSKKALVPVNILASGTIPTGRYAGDMYYNTETGLMVYTGSVWSQVSSANPTVLDAGSFDGVAPYMGGRDPSEVSTQTFNGGTP